MEPYFIRVGLNAAIDRSGTLGFFLLALSRELAIVREGDFSFSACLARAFGLVANTVVEKELGNPSGRCGPHAHNPSSDR